MFTPESFFLYHVIFSEPYRADRFQQSSPFVYRQQLAVTHRSCATYSNGKPCEFEGREHTHYIISVHPKSNGTCKSLVCRIRGSIVRQASYERGKTCQTCSKSAASRSNSCFCSDCRFRCRVKLISSKRHLINDIRYLQRAFGIGESFTQKKGEAITDCGESPR